jgi:ribosomal peptide maturation radical SAM protein 1
MRVLLVCAPFAALDRPALGLSALKASAAEAGFTCDVVYLNLEFARLLGTADYDRVVGRPPTALAGEWAFAGGLPGADERVSRAYVTDVLHNTIGRDPEGVAAVLRARALARPFLKQCLTKVEWSRYDVVGLGSTGPQNAAAMALAWRLRKRFPGLTLVVGGHNWSGTMGRAQFKRFPCIDYAFTGEADEGFPQFLTALRGHDHSGICEVPGLLRRTRRGRRRESPARPTGDLDSLPVPDHGDYFKALVESGVALAASPVVPLEASRGCWWADRGPCTFCGMNGDTPRYRSKSPARVLREIDELTGAWPGLRLDVVDSVVPPRFLRRVVARLAERPDPPKLRFKIRPDVRRADLEAAAHSGASVVCGIESLDDGLLQMMGKGVGALENVRLLKWCRELGVRVEWNLLWGLPGETAKAYRAQLRLIGALDFADAPAGPSPVVLERSSVLWRDARDRGFGAPRAASAYTYVYPFPSGDLARMAYYFEHEYAPDIVVALHLRRLERRLREWRDAPGGGVLRRVDGGDGLVRLVDERSGSAGVPIELGGVEGLLFDACDEIRSVDDLRRLARRELDGATTRADIRRVMRSLVDRSLMAASGDRYLNLAIPARTEGPVSAVRRPAPG